MSQSHLDSYRSYVEKEKSRGVSNRQIAIDITKLGTPTSEKSVRRALKRWKTNVVAFQMNGEEAIISAPPSRLVTDPEELMKELGVDPRDWEITNIVVNKWGDMGEPMYQLKANLKRIKPVNLVMPGAPPLDYQHNWESHEPRKGGFELAIHLSDTHAPFHDENLHRLVCEWINYNRPDRGYFQGDLGDFAELSKHRHKPEWKSTAQKSVDTGVGILYDWRQADPLTVWECCPGNHDDRIRNAIIDYNADMIGLRPGQLPGEAPKRAIYDLNTLFRGDELGMTWVDPQGGFEFAQLFVTPKLGVRHGWLVRPKSGATALGTLEHLGHSVYVGHTHRQSIVHETKFDIYGKPEVRVAAEVGCLCVVNKQGLGYQPSPNWQPGFMTSVIWPDGTFTPEKAIYVNRKLFWREQVFE